LFSKSIASAELIFSKTDIIFNFIPKLVMGYSKISIPSCGEKSSMKQK